MAKDPKKIFPNDFLWGASTSAHQVEGGNHNQWTVWEKENAEKLAKTAHRRLSWMPGWDEFKDRAAEPDNYISGRGVEHYTRFEEDFDILGSLGMNSFRFSIEWSRIEPEEGVWNETEIEHYRKYIKELKKRDIEPVLNLWHWTNPVWFEEKGAFKYKKNLRYFERFVQKVADEYVTDLKYVITINEALVYSSFSYMVPDVLSNIRWTPGEKNPLSLIRVLLNLSRAHKKSYVILKKSNPSLQIGIAAQLGNVQAKDPHHLSDELSTKMMRYFWNWWFLNRVREYQDFVGINYYFTDYYDGLFKKKSPKVPINDVGWYMEPEGLYPLLLRAWAHYGKPIIVTENGVADSHDQYRRWWIEETIVAMERAISQGVLIKGYFHWSLLDNFEWAGGWVPKFGLVEVDRENGMKRKIRPSAKWFADKIKELS